MYMLRKRKNNTKLLTKSRLLKVGSLLLIIIGIGIIVCKYFYEYNLEQEETTKIDIFLNEQTDVENETSSLASSFSNENEKSSSQSNENFIAVLEIPKIDLKKGIYSINSKNNNVDKNIMLLNESDMPDVINGNFILAGHSGTGYNAYFKELKNLELGDSAYIYYKNNKYKYNLIDKYEVEKTGKALIIKDSDISALTLITCKDNENKQLVFIFELEVE